MLPGAPLTWLFAVALGWPAAAPVSDPELAASLLRAADAAARGGRPSEAVPAYLEAGRLAPEVGDWLLLRAAELTADSAGRYALYARLELAPARSRVTAVEAAARERTADWTGAAARYDSLGREADAWRVRLLGTTGAERQAVRAGLATRLEAAADATRARALSDVFLQVFPVPTAAEALRLARAASLSRHDARAAQQYARADRAGITTARDRLAWGTALVALGRHREAVTVLGRVAGPPEVSAQARLGSARARLKSGDPAGAGAALWALVERYPGEHEPAAGALLLLGELAQDRGELAEARRIWRDLASRYPSSRSAPRARFLAALVAFQTGSPGTAAREWARLRIDAAGTEIGAASGYWSGRAWERAGELRRAEEAWREVVERDTLSYYAAAGARRLGVPSWTPAPRGAEFGEEPGLVPALHRIGVLERLGMSREVRWERETLVTSAAGEPERLLTVADAFRRTGQQAAAIRLARQALAAGAPGDARTYRLLYPLGYEDQLRQLATEAGLEPGLLAALIRQESAWEPRATSAAGARGLMQVMPATGAQLASRLGVSGWHPDRLYEAETNLRLGTSFFVDMVRRHGGDPIRALAAYNAGPARVARWSARVTSDDAELFVERIPFTETRDYVRLVLRNLALYRALYDAG